MNTGPRASPDAAPAAIRSFSRLPADSRRSCPVGRAASRLARCRSAQNPPVIRAAPSGTGHSRQDASAVGATATAGADAALGSAGCGLGLMDAPRGSRSQDTDGTLGTRFLTATLDRASGTIKVRATSFRVTARLDGHALPADVYAVAPRSPIGGKDPHDAFPGSSRAHRGRGGAGRRRARHRVEGAQRVRAAARRDPRAGPGGGGAAGLHAGRVRARAVLGPQL